MRALDDVPFDLRPGEVHALMGENGAGKSTLMKILTGIYRRDAGEILLDGAPVDIASPRAAQALGIGIIHQELNLMNHLTAAQNIFIGREPRARLRPARRDSAQRAGRGASSSACNLALDPRTAVGDADRRQPADGRDRQGAVVSSSRVLIMDEPTAALNDAEVDELFRIIRQLRGAGRRHRLHLAQDGRARSASPTA